MTLCSSQSLMDQGFLLAEPFLAFGLGVGVTLALGLAAAATPAFAGAFLSTVAFDSFAANLTGAGLRVVGPTELFCLRRHLPNVRSGAAASNALHSSSVRLFGSRSFGIFALRDLSVMYGP